jgi:hypothetical protein
MNHKYEQRTSSSRMGNLLAHAVSTQYDIRNTKICKTNPICRIHRGELCKTKPIFPPIFQSLLQLYTRKMRTFHHNLQKMRAFCKFLKLTYLTPYTTKAYKTFSLGIPFTFHEMRDKKKCKTNPISFSPPSHYPTRPTGHGTRGTSHDSCKTNPIHKRTNVSAALTMTYGNIRGCS